MRLRLFALFALLCAMGAAPAAPAHIQENLGAARLAGTGAYTWFGLRIYDAELWVDRQGYRADAPFVLELRYARRLEGAKIAQASFDEMEKLNGGTPLQRAAWLVRMKQIFPDVKQGTRIGAANLPAGGVRFYLDGMALADVPDRAFARAFFAIWLDPATSAPGLRAALLRDAAPR